MAFQTKRNNSAQPLIDIIGHPDHGGKEMHYVQHTGLSKVEETALRIYTATVPKMLFEQRGAAVLYGALATASINAANAFWDEIERPARELEYQYDVKTKADREEYERDNKTMLQKVADAEITEDEYNSWVYNLIGD